MTHYNFSAKLLSVKWLTAACFFLVSSLPLTANAQDVAQSVRMVDFDTGDPMLGAGTLVRNRNGARVNLSAGELDPYTSYTVWWVVWNKPERCNDGCGVDDLGIKGNAVFYASGFMTGSEGIINLDTVLDAGRLPIGLEAPVPGKLRKNNGLNAEIHVVLRNHGTISPDILVQQLSTFEATGCESCYDQGLLVFDPVSKRKANKSDTERW